MKLGPLVRIGSILALSVSAWTQSPPPPAPLFGNSLGVVWNPMPTGTLRRNLWLPNLPVTSLHATAERVYAGGSFSQLSLSSGGSVRLASSDAAPDIGWPRTDGPVYTILEDGAGGWYVGGNFTIVESLSRRALIHVLPNRDVDPAFDALMSANRVNALCLSNGVLYVGGVFSTAGGQARRNLCALNATTGAVLPWNPILGPSWGSSSEIKSLALHGGDLYVAGTFQETVQGLPRRFLMVVDVASGAILPWDPMLDAEVLDLSLDGNDLALAGQFTQMLGSPRSKLAVLDVTTAQLQPFSATLGSTAFCVDLDGGEMFVGGLFSTANGVARNRAAAFDVATGALLPWNPNLSGTVGGDLLLRDVLASGADVVITGSFLQVGADARECAAVVDRVTGQARPWSAPLAGGTPTSGHAIVTDGGWIELGGDFRQVGKLLRNGVAAFSLASGVPSAWNPNAPGTKEIAEAGGVVYLGGYFSAINGQPRRFVAAVDGSTGLVTQPFDATSLFTVVSTTVNALAVGNGRVFVGGDFTTTTGRNSILALDAITGQPVPGWDSNIGGVVNDLAMSADRSELYVGGQFATAGVPSQTRLSFAVIDAATGALKPAHPNPGGSVYAVLESAGRVFVGGSFNSLGGVTAPRLGQIDPLTGLAYAWTPLVNPGPGTTYVTSLARLGRYIYCGGRFQNVNGVSNPYVGAVDMETSIRANWLPNPSHEVYAVAAARDRAFVAGEFQTIGGTTMPYLAAFQVQ